MIADTQDALTPQWLTYALGGLLDGASVTDVEASSVGTGQLSTSVRLRLSYDRPTPAPSTIVAKLPSADTGSREIARSLRSYEIEVRFYQLLAPDLPIRTPRVYYANIDVSTASFVLLLEDLAPARQGDQLAGCSVADATIAVDELVKLHAPRWGDPALAGYDWLHRDSDRTFMAQMLPPLWDAFRDRFADRLGPDVHAAGEVLFGNFERYLASDDDPWTVVHRDYRLDNLLFGNGTGGVPIAVVDWQTAAHGPALTDVAYFIGAGLRLDDRREHERDLVRRYHDGLVAAGVDDYAFDVCWTAHRRGTWAGLITSVAAAMLVERTARGDDMFMTMAHRHARHALDLDAPALLTT